MENIVSRIDNNYKILKFKGTRNDFASLLQNNPGIFIFKFTADWCGPCKKLGPIVKKIAKKHSDKLQLIEIDVDANKELAQEKGIRST